METRTIRQQEEQYLESPHSIKDTNPGRQTPFLFKNAVRGGSVFSKKSFLTHPQPLKEKKGVNKNFGLINLNHKE